MHITTLRTSLAMLGFLLWSGFTGPPTRGGCASPDSLVIVRVVRPADELLNAAPVMYVSRGKGKIEKVEMTDLKGIDPGKTIRNTINSFVNNGFVLESVTESTDNGIKLSSFYFKKRVI